MTRAVTPVRVVLLVGRESVGNPQTFPPIRVQFGRAG